VEYGNNITEKYPRKHKILLVIHVQVEIHPVEVVFEVHNVIEPDGQVVVGGKAVDCRGDGASDVCNHACRLQK